MLDYFEGSQISRFLEPGNQSNDRKDLVTWKRFAVSSYGHVATNPSQAYIILTRLIQTLLES